MDKTAPFPYPCSHTVVAVRTIVWIDPLRVSLQASQKNNGSRQRKAKRLDPTPSQGLLECGRLLSRGVCGVGGGAGRIGKGGSQKAKGGSHACRVLDRGPYKGVEIQFRDLESM